MDIISFTQDIRHELDNHLESIQTATPDDTLYGAALSVVSSAILRLKQFAIAYRFRDQIEEINFFKNEKPQILSQYFFYKKLLRLQLEQPGPRSNLQEYYKPLVHEEANFVQKNREFCRYVATEETFMDEKYFLRRGNLPSEIDERFSTGYDIKLAKLIAFRQLRIHAAQMTSQSNLSGSQALNWTGAKIDLIELIYAFHASGVVNNGKTDIKQIAENFEQLFDIRLGNYYRLFQDIRMRKKNQTVFIDKLKDDFMNKLTEMDAN